jgi:formylglycine-generating enzyme required for sulfatase activity
MGTDPSARQGSNRPVEMVSWDECREFCLRVTAHAASRAAVRLPTEAEWEWACRAGTTTEYYCGDALNTDLANYQGHNTWNDSPQGQYRGETTDVGSFPPNPWGLFDLSGNVAEWCADGYWPYSTANPEGTGGPAQEHVRAYRGGSWQDGPEFCRCATRLYLGRASRFRRIGFRVVFHPV